MKPQDILFIIILIGLLFSRRPNWLVSAGLISLILSIPLFHFWIFFTAERLIIYAFFFILFAVLLNLAKIRHNK